MRDLLYYPGFESKNEDWLKFALIYIDKLNPIVPVSGDNQKSPLYKKLTNETDLIHQYRPSFDDGYLSTLDAIDFTERIFRRPESFDMVFNHVNPLRQWQNKDNYTFELYEEKFSGEWRFFCLETGLAIESNRGIMLDESFGNFYMTILANTIGDASGKQIITDRSDLDRMGLLLKAKGPKIAKEIEMAHAIVEIKLPKLISQISIDDLIKLRNSTNFKTQQKAFHATLESFCAGVESGDTANSYIEKYDKASKDIFETIVSAGFDVATFALGTQIAFSNPEFSNTDVLKTFLLAGGVYIKSKMNLSKTWKNTADHRNSRKFLQNLSQID
ncbi:hypothetical protein [Pedobacter mendelii]|uniref:Uncharacterized protein n=1 Tax=Pedobacter mendelii TaxID=1908240 RepID=A0ABQ2BE51_9SPHI|nr:hypothetical protein [Pedobacter mendelii]GGI23878.1 hypothetical protein GCM10008119_09860 [Pedobacter mendelii]